MAQEHNLPYLNTYINNDFQRGILVDVAAAVTAAAAIAPIITATDRSAILDNSLFSELTTPPGQLSKMFLQDDHSYGHWQNIFSAQSQVRGSFSPTGLFMLYGPYMRPRISLQTQVRP
jgi:hypothetical protein